MITLFLWLRMEIETKMMVDGKPFSVKIKNEELVKIEHIEPENQQKSTHFNKKRDKNEIKD
ncbi:MAG: hypothetical protein PWQ59_434 [Thermoanaerobacterium sp.]|nr:hypothetical protein [Thermoanaerobacterium sp.]